MKNKPSTFSVITATLDSERFIGRLLRSLEDQTDDDFSFVVFDGGSTDKTEEVIRSSNLKNVTILKGRDSGIYDALNRCIAEVQTDYYIVCGADDQLSHNALKHYKSSADISGADIICSKVKIGESIVVPRKKMAWLYGMGGLSSSHSVGVAIRTGLHEKYGLYSKKLPIAADQLFIKRVHADGGVFHYADFVSGEFALSGTSGTDTAGVLTESFRVQLATEKHKFLQLLIFLARIVKNYNKL